MEAKSENSGNLVAISTQRISVKKMQPLTRLHISAAPFSFASRRNALRKGDATEHHQQS